MTAYIVGYDTGEYDDYSDAPVCIYLGSQAKRQAEAHARKANEWLEANGYLRESARVSATDHFTDNPFDPEPRTVDYTGARYSAWGPYPVNTRVPRG